MYGLTEKNCQNLTQSWQAKGTCRCDGYWGEKQEENIESSTNIDRKARKHNTYPVITIELKKSPRSQKMVVTYDERRKKKGKEAPLWAKRQNPDSFV